MRKLWVGSIGLVAAAIGPGWAADLPKRPVYKAPPPVVASVPLFSWTGCYLGGHVGGGWGRKEFSDPIGALFAPPGEVVRVNTSGFLGGGQIGCDWQFAPNWVIGIEGAASWADIKGDTFVPVTPGTLHAKTDFLASATGRVGWTWDRWMLFAKSGAAWDHDKYDFTGQTLLPCFGEPGGLLDCVTKVKAVPTAFDFAASETRTGWTVGAGVEWAFWNNWSAKLEYDFYEFGRRRLTFVDSTGNFPGLAVPVDIDQRIHTVKFGINYRFAWGKAPVVAKY